VDSPEAFEEILWKLFWCDHYKKDRIVPWKGERNEEFFDFFRNHIRKIIAIRGNHSISKARYVSKNNLNIARLDLLRHHFPDAVIMVPFRHPLQHAASLLRQHRNFLEIHNRDSFARHYMSAIGHYDFGEDLRPIDFDDWLESARWLDPMTLTYWMEYWIAAYKHLGNKTNGLIRFISYEVLCKKPAESLERIADIIEVDQRGAFLKQKSRIRVAEPYPVIAENLPQKIVDEAEALYLKLREIALI
jgi:hypothetical protein